MLATKASWTALATTNTALRTLINDRLQVANAVATYLTKNNPVITGTLTANGSTGTAGYYLRTSGTRVYWSPAAAGTGGSSGGTTANVVTKTLDSLKGTDTVVTSVSGVVINSGITTGKAIAMAIVFGG